MTSSGILKFFVVTIATATACGESSRVHDASVALATSITDSLNQQRGSANRTIRPARVSADTGALYLDVSQSMRGFVACGDRPTEFDATLDQLAVALGVRTVGVFGADRAQANFSSVPVSRALHCPASYNQRQNPDYALFRRISVDSVSAYSGYLTDGVQSDAILGTPSPSVAELERWMQTGNALAIVAFRSRFSGAAWSEATQKWLSPTNVARRPFYLILLARDETVLDQVLSRISSLVAKSEVTIRFAPPLLSCALRPTNVEREDGRADPFWMLLSTASTASIRTTRRSLAEFTCSIGGDSPIASIGVRSVSTSYRRWTGSVFTSPVAIPAGSEILTTAQPGAGSSIASIALRGPDDANTRHGLYQTILTPEVGSIRQSIRELSTDDDGAVADLEKTYRFAWLIERLARAQVERDLRPIGMSITTFYRD